jgi:hypothetical protein
MRGKGVQKIDYFITNRRIEGADDSWAWDWLDAEDEKEYERLRREGKVIVLDEEEVGDGNDSDAKPE